MNKPEFFVTPGYGERQLRMFHYSQAVKVGNRIETSGQGGWDDDWQFSEALADEIAQAFRNVERTLANAGAGWEHVIAVNSYHLEFPEEVNQIMTEQFRSSCLTTPPFGLHWELLLSATQRCVLRSGSQQYFLGETCSKPGSHGLQWAGIDDAADCIRTSQPEMFCDRFHIKS
jgi:enamine deaminase RidA (YjgF/YER057c/UK114 family)